MNIDVCEQVKGWCPDCQFSHDGKCGELIDCIGCGEQKQSFNDNVRLCKPCRDRLVGAK